MISIHAPREGGDCAVAVVFVQLLISIHAPREGGDDTTCARPSGNPHFNPRPPRGGRQISAVISNPLPAFQSTPPARGATWPFPKIAILAYGFQSTPPARGATPAQPPPLRPGVISIHAPREGGDFPVYRCHVGGGKISIHAPREGGDALRVSDIPGWQDFNPRPPRGGRPGGIFVYPLFLSFQSTPPARGATEALASVDLKGEFQSTPPARGATNQAAIGHHVFAISIHAPREGGDENRRHPRPAGDHFNPRPPRGGRRCVMYPSASS